MTTLSSCLETQNEPAEFDVCRRCRKMQRGADQYALKKQCALSSAQSKDCEPDLLKTPMDKTGEVPR